MELIPNVHTKSFCIYLVKSKVLIISDIHIGYEESMNNVGVLVPRSFFKEMYENARQILAELDCKTIIINGDLKHDFGKILKTEWSHTLKFLDLFKGKDIYLVKGIMMSSFIYYGKSNNQSSQLLYCR